MELHRTYYQGETLNKVYCKGSETRSKHTSGQKQRYCSRTIQNISTFFLVHIVGVFLPNKQTENTPANDRMNKMWWRYFLWLFTSSFISMYYIYVTQKGCLHWNCAHVLYCRLFFYIKFKTKSLVYWSCFRKDWLLNAFKKKFKPWRKRVHLASRWLQRIILSEGNIIEITVFAC